jgi:1-acyl-sn-glycerol-3-phosphate acyltransferase
VLAAGFKPLLRSELDVEVCGAQLLDEIEPPVLFVSNHQSHVDAPMILTCLPMEWRTRTAVGAAADYFFDVWWRAAATALAFNAFPVDRAGGRRTVGLARRLLLEGYNLLVFPEGTRSHDGWVTEFHQGAARLSQHARIPVVPIAISGSYQAMPRGRAWPAPGRPPVTVRFCDVVYPADNEPADAYTARIRRAVATGLDENMTCWWDAIRRRARGEVDSSGGPKGAHWRRVWEASRPVERSRRPTAWVGR